MTYSQIVRVGKGSRANEGSGSRPEHLHSSSAASRTYSEFFGQVPKAGLRYLLLLTGITNILPVRGGRARSVRIVKTVKTPDHQQNHVKKVTVSTVN